MKAPKEEKSRTLAPEGQHIARCYIVAFIGHQTVQWQGQTKEQAKLVLSFELPTETHIFKEENGPEPFTISKTLTMSMDARGNMRKFIEAWRGKPYANDDEAWDVDFRKFAGHPGLINLAHEHKDGKTYCNITSLVPVPKGMTTPNAFNKPLIYDIREHKDENLVRLPEWIQKKVKESREWRNYTPPKDDEPAPTSGEKYDIDEIPF